MQLSRLDHQVFRKVFKKWFHNRYIALMDSAYSGNQIQAHNISQASPIIVVGMHRSGTSLLIQALDELGLFSGDITGPDTSESLLFQYLNDAALNAAQAHWSMPENLPHTLNNTHCQHSLLSIFSQALSSHWKHFYKLAHATDTLNGKNGPFGWKDPRNCLTLPLWSTLYPNARYVFIHRHGLDVAHSHVNREKRVGQSIYITRCLNLDRSFELWEEYNRQALSALSLIPNEQKINIGFETLLQSPQETLNQIADFCALRAPKNKLHQFAQRCDPSKAYAYQQLKTTELSDHMRDSLLLAQLGYTL